MGVRHLGYVSEETLPLLYNAARCLAFPSYYEGFGLPPVEMLACGGAVLASNIATLTETVGNCAALIAPGDADAWRHALLQAASDEDWLRGLRRGAVQAMAAYSWEKTAEQAWDAYAQMLEPTPPRDDTPGLVAAPGRDLSRAA
jgi:alpha-1,3-rhamnosyl/mannosyltransferase